MTTLMKFILFAFVFSTTCNFVTHANEKKKKNLEKHKARITERADRHIVAINEFKSCVQGAVDHPAIQACRKAKREKMGKMGHKIGGKGPMDHKMKEGQ